ncbi:MAG: transporter [Rhodobacterales bacterium]|nr:MAG: transporter [Rhodobacterales bacterium]
MRAKTIRAVATAALGCALVFGPSAATAESLSDAMVSAYRTSGLLTQQRALLRAADEDYAAAVAALRPTIAYALKGGLTRRDLDTTPATPGEGTTNTLSASATLSASFLLYDFGRTRLQSEMAHETVLMTRDTLVGVEQKVLLRAIKAFLNVRSTHEKAMLQANNVRLITEELRAARDRFEVGEITQTDVSAAEAALAFAKASEAAARGDLMIAREEYKAAIGHYPNSLKVPPAAPVTVRSVTDAKAVARRSHPEVLAQQRAVKITDIAVDVAHKGMLPSLKASGFASRSINDSDHYTERTSLLGAELELSGVIYAGGQLSAMYRKAKAQAEANRAALYTTVQNVEQSVANAWAQLAVAQASLQARDQEIRANRVALRGAREEATLGARTTLEVLSFEQDLLDAQAARISAQSNEYLAVYNLLASMGLLTAEKLGLGIATYDPEAYFNAVKDAPVRDVSPQGKKLDAIIETLGRATR